MAERAASDLNYLRWQAAPSAPSISISFDAMAGIESEVTAGLKALSRRGAEAGGALLGSRNPENGEFVVEGFYPITIEHAVGPSYVLSKQDLDVWRREVAQLRTASPAFIGIYRSQTRPGLQVDSDDCAMVEKLLPREKGVFLLVKPLSVSESVGAFFLCDGGAVIDEAVNEREFPFGSRAVRNASSDPPKSSSKMARWVPWTAVAAGVAMALFFHFRTGVGTDENPVGSDIPASAEVVTTSFHLRVAPDGSNARIEWDPGSAPLRGATLATIDVADGNTRETLRLTSRDLQTGYVEWHPRSAQATFDMRVIRPGGLVARDAVHFLNPAYPINSSSDTVITKPAPELPPSAVSGDGKRAVHRTVHALPSEVSRAMALQTQKPGRVRRMLNSVTSKASHLWPFHSAKPERQTQ